MTPDAVVKKFMGAATLTLSAARAERVCEAVLGLERLSARELAAALRP